MDDFEAFAFGEEGLDFGGAFTGDLLDVVTGEGAFASGDGMAVWIDNVDNVSRVEYSIASSDSCRE